MSNWKNIKGLSGYEISKTGLVAGSGVCLSIYDNGNGYVFVKIKGKQYYVHRLVAQAFIPNPENKPQVNHKDGRKWNNALENLEWATPSENGIHAYANGLNHVSEYQKLQTSLAGRGSKCFFAVLKEADIPKIREYKKQGLTNTEIGKMYNVHRETIGYIIRGKTWKHV